MRIKLTIFLLTLFTSSFSFGQTNSDTTVTKTYTYTVVNLSGVEDLNVDTTITGFHFAANFQGTIIYTPNGEPDLNTINPSAFSFTIMPNATFKAALNEIEQLLNMAKNDGFEHTDIKKADTTINGYKAYYISFTETRKNPDYKNLVFDAFVIKDDKAILFVSGDLDNGKHIENFKRTFYSIKL